MSEIMKTTFEIDEPGRMTLRFEGGNIRGYIAAIIIELEEPADLVVMSIQSGNLCVLVPTGGVPVAVLNRLPLKLEFMVGCRVFAVIDAPSSAKFPIHGRAWAVLHAEEPPEVPRPPPRYGFGLVPMDP